VKQAFDQNQLPEKGAPESDVVARFGPPTSKTQTADQTTYSWIYTEGGPKHPGLIWIPIAGMFFIGAESRTYQLTVICEQEKVTTVSTTQNQGSFGN
jgi:hypothetical protein